jgi:nicotinate phosphoribosyltransferase
MLNELYKPSLSLLTDLYELTMAYGYWKKGFHERDAVFHLFFRHAPFSGGYAVACGLEAVCEFLEQFSFDDTDIACLEQLAGSDGEPLFEEAFLTNLRSLSFSCDVDAVPEGTVVFAHEPLVRISGPLLQAQIMESALLNIINFQTLIATKAVRVVEAACGDPVLEFGLRRAQGIDGAISAARAAYIGGCAGSSNVLANRLMGIPVKGTHAHSWVMCFDSELEAFEAYAEAMPNNCVFLVDTYDTLDGVRNAVEVGKRLREKGQELLGIRLDSGDLAYLSVEARRILDENGFTETRILASNDLDEYTIDSLKDQGAAIAVWGVGTRLVSAYDQPALGGVYKLAAVKGDNGHWEYRIKLSEQTIKISTPGVLQVRRYYRDGEAIADGIYDIEQGVPCHDKVQIVSPEDPVKRKVIPEGAVSEDLLVPVFRRGERVYQSPSLAEMREYCQQQVGSFYRGVRRFVNPHAYPAGLVRALHDRKMDMIENGLTVKTTDE